MKIRATALLLTTVLGCGNHRPGDVAAVRSTTPPSLVAPALPVLPGAETLPFGSPRSSIDFVGSKRTLSHDGSFESFTGTIQLVPDHVESSRVSVRIQTSSLLTPIVKLTADLRSSGFLGADLFPSASFVSTAIVPVAGRTGSYVVSGDFTLHGVSHPIQIPAEITVTPAEVVVHGRFVLSRGMFGVGRPPAEVTHNAPRPDPIRDEVVIRIAIRAARPRVANRP